MNDANTRHTRAIDTLRQSFGDKLQTGQALRDQHAATLTWLPQQPPDAVLFASDADDVIAAVQIAAAHKMPLIPFGSGTSLEGHVNAPLGGLSLDMSRMTRIIAVNAEDLDVEIEAGVTRDQLNSHLRDSGLFFPIDPGAGNATLGGMAATRASGTTAVRYGTMRDNVVNVTAVLADGQLIRTGQRARKSSAGYDLTRLFVGSEGTLGVITSLTLKVHGIPEVIRAAVCPFPSLGTACAAVIEAIQLALGMARIELLDEVQIRASNAYAGLSLAETPTLFLEFHGSEQATSEQVAMFRSIAESHGCLGFEHAQSTEARNQLWKARHSIFWANKGLRPGTESVATDVCVPISRLADCVTETKADIAELQLVAPLVGHVGDGNFHVQVLIDMANAAEVARARTFLERLARRALAMAGTCTGEHGIGQGKRGYLADEHGAAVAVMRRIKQALDPDGLFNPGKIFP